MKKDIEYYKMPPENIHELIHFIINENHLHHREIVTAEDINSTRQILCSQCGNTHLPYRQIRCIQRSRQERFPYF